MSNELTCSECGIIFTPKIARRPDSQNPVCGSKTCYRRRREKRYPSASAIYSAKWRAANPEKAAINIARATAKSGAKSRLKTAHKRASHARYSGGKNKGVLDMLVRGKDPVDVAFHFGIPLSRVMAQKKFLP